MDVRSSKDSLLYVHFGQGWLCGSAGATWKQHEPVWSYREECDQVTNEEPGGALKQRPIHINKFGIHKMNARLVACV